MPSSSAVYKWSQNLSEEFAHAATDEMSDHRLIEFLSKPRGIVTEWHRPRLRWIDMHTGDDYADGYEGRQDLPRPDLD